MRIGFIRIALLALACAIAPAGAQAAANDALQPPALRLPQDARPTRYALTLTVVPGAATAPGEIAIDVALAAPRTVLWLNADALKVTQAAVSAPATQVGIAAGH